MIRRVIGWLCRTKHAGAKNSTERSQAVERPRPGREFGANRRARERKPDRADQ